MGELKFAFTTTSGNPLRALTFEIIQRQLKSVGIELTPRFVSPAVLFGGGTLTCGDWQIVMFTFIGGPTTRQRSSPPAAVAAARTTTRCCNRKSTDLLEKAQFTADAAERNKLLQQADVDHGGRRLLVPLFSRPRSCCTVKVKGPLRNPTQQGITWNAESWSATT